MSDESPKGPQLELLPGTKPATAKVEYVDPVAFADFAGENFDEVAAKNSRQNAEGLFTLGCAKLAHHVVISVGITAEGVPMGAVSLSSRLNLPDEVVLQHILAVVVQRFALGQQGSIDPNARPEGEGN